MSRTVRGALVPALSLAAWALAAAPCDARADAPPEAAGATPEAARAAAWHEGPRGRHRVRHLVAVAAAGAAYAASEALLKDALAPAGCRWCAPPGLDGATRDALVWDDRRAAARLSTATGYVAAPLLAFGLTAAGVLADDGGAGELLDAALPIAEAVAYSELVVQAFKFAVGRARPEVHYGTATTPPGNDDNLSFFSGHSDLAFSLAVGAGVVAHRRHARLEPVIWAGGLALAASTAYLRIAADKHYLSDVVTGGAVGALAGWLVPTLASPEADPPGPRAGSLGVVPTGRGLAVVGAF